MMSQVALSFKNIYAPQHYTCVYHYNCDYTEGPMTYLILGVPSHVNRAYTRDDTDTGPEVGARVDGYRVRSAVHSSICS